MGESNLTLTKDQLAARLARKYGGSNSTTYAGLTAEMTAVFAQGFRWFYFPGMAGGDIPHHKWSFLKSVVATITTTDAQQADDLLEDFGAIVSGFTRSTAASTTRRIQIISIEELLAIDARDAPDDAEPLYAAIRVKTAAGSTSQRYEIVWHPTPDDNGAANYTYNYTYDILPDLPSAAGDYPYGGAAHTETLLQAIFAAGELREDDERGIEWARYLELLKTSIAFDQDVLKQAAAVRPWPIGKASTDLSQLYDDCAMRIGRYLEFGHDFEGFTHNQIEMVDSVIQQGLRQMYEPPVLPGETGPHQWRFLQPVTTIDLWQAIAHTYDKTTVTVSINGGGLTATASSAIFTSDMVGDYICPHETGSGFNCVKITAFTSSTVVTVAESVTITSETFTVSPYFVTGTNIATLTAQDSQTPFFPSMVGRTFSFYRRDGTADTRTIITYTSSSVIVVDSVMENVGGGWGFSMDCTGDFRLPKDFAGICGPLTHVADSGECHFEVDVWHESRIRKLRQCNTTATGRPEYAGVEPLKYDGNVQYASDGTTSQAFDLRIWPCPDSNYVLEYQYDIIPPKLTATVKYLPGGAMLHETILASCLAAAEMEKTGEQGPRWAKFMERLAASVGRDRVAISAEKIGLNRDLSDQPPSNLGRVRHTQGRLVTYTGGG